MPLGPALASSCAAFALSTGCASPSAPPSVSTSPAPAPAISSASASASASAVSAAPTGPGAELRALVADYVEAVKRLDPFYAPDLDWEEGLGEFGDYPSEAYLARGKALSRATLEKIRRLDANGLNSSDRRLLSLFAGDVERDLLNYEFPQELLDFHQMRNRMLSYLEQSSPALTTFPFDSTPHYEAFLRRADGFPAYVDRQIALLRKGIRTGIVLSCEVARRVPDTYREGLEPDDEKHPFWRPTLRFPDSIGEADRARLRERFRAAIREKLRPGFRKFDAFYKTEYVPKCRKGYGLAGLPRAQEWYRLAIYSKTDSKYDPKDLHAFGLREVARIEKDLDAIAREIGFKGSRAEFVRSLKTDPRYFYASKQEMLDDLRAVRARIDAKVPGFFSLVPKAECRIVESENPAETGASYKDPTDNAPYGRYVVAAANPRSLPKYEATTLSVHEAVPGHHFQLAIQYEAKDRLSEYQRKLFFSNAFVEGWALYAERLGDEMGLYSDPIARAGNRIDDMLRAVRLVVDTGIHAFGWSKAKATAYARERLTMSEDDLSKELDRYSVWPAQALSYKVGQRKILELRAEAEKELGARFDLREFHRAVLENGTVSLQALEDQVREWIAKTRARI